MVWLIEHEFQRGAITLVRRASLLQLGGGDGELKMQWYPSCSKLARFRGVEGPRTCTCTQLASKALNGRQAQPRQGILQKPDGLSIMCSYSVLMLASAPSAADAADAVLRPLPCGVERQDRLSSVRKNGNFQRKQEFFRKFGAAWVPGARLPIRWPIGQKGLISRIQA